VGVRYQVLEIHPLFKGFTHFQKGLTKIRKSNGYKKPSREINLRRV